MRLERELTLRLPVLLEGSPADRVILEAYLQDPGRVLQDLLRSRKLKALPHGRFRHVPRPIVLGPLKLTPRVLLQTRWQAPQLSIELKNYALPGLESLQQRVRFRFDAQIAAGDSGLELKARVSLEVARDGIGTLVPQPVQRYLADRLLEQTLDRLQQRCLKFLPTALQTWQQERDHDPGLTLLEAP